MMYKPIAARTVCVDGASLSIQASRTHYCKPRADVGPYSHKEVGYITDDDGNPLTPPEEWREYADGDFPSSVYGYVPVDLIDDFIAKHGGPK